MALGTGYSIMRPGRKEKGPPFLLGGGVARKPRIKEKRHKASLLVSCPRPAVDLGQLAPCLGPEFIHL